MDETSSIHSAPILPPTPRGLESLYSLCREIYPDQVNPLQVTALVKYWLGGPDPLDYISMYANPGIPDENIPAHWHYISFGLSDLHGDGRVHEPSTGDANSGFGFELTFRLKREPDETAPPTWPATLMQSLAKYVFQSGNILCAGDHVSWHCALDNSDSRIQHMLMTTDPQLQETRTPFGNVAFVQIVGVCQDELRAAQQWNAIGVLHMLSRVPQVGAFHLTDMRRRESVFEIDSNARLEVEQGFEVDGSNLSGVSARCSWSEQSSDMPNVAFKEAFLRDSVDLEQDQTIKQLNCVHLVFDLEAGNLLPLAIRGRVTHGRHFTFKSVLTGTAITLVAESVTGTLVTTEHPYVAKGAWLQVLIPNDLAQDMAATFQTLANPESLSLPKTFSWPDKKLSISVVPDKLS